MRSHMVTAFLTALAFLAPPLLADEGGSASDDKPKLKKADVRQGPDLAERLEVLEQEVRELTALVRKRQGVSLKQPQKLPAKDGGAIGMIKARLAGGDKQPAKPGKPQGPGEGQVRLVKGPDGQLLVPLSALPPDLQKELLTRSKSADEPQKTAIKKPAANAQDAKTKAGKAEEKADKADKDDDDDDDEKDDDKKKDSKQRQKDDD